MIDDEDDDILGLLNSMSVIAHKKTIKTKNKNKGESNLTTLKTAKLKYNETTN